MSFRTLRFAAHYYAIQGMATAAVISPSKQHRLGAKFLLLRTLQWATAPIRCKLILSLMHTSPYPSVAGVMIGYLKQEMQDAYDWHRKRREGGAERIQGGDEWFCNLAVLDQLLRKVRSWGQKLLRSDPPAAQMSWASESHRELFDCLASGLNLILHVLMCDRRSMMDAFSIQTIVRGIRAAFY
jgi:hypothetical protein